MNIVVDCKPIRTKLIEEIRQEVAGLSHPVHLAMVQVLGDEASSFYVKNKEKLSKETGIISSTKYFENDVTQAEIEYYIMQLAQDPEVNGIMLQLPLPKHLDSQKILSLIPAEKDVDGLTVVNQGLLATGNLDEALVSCTPEGVIYLLEQLGYKDFSGLDVAVIGRSNLFGKPMAQLLTHKNATVTLCHSKTENLSAKLRQMDIIISAVGQPGLVNEHCISSKTETIIDVGMTYNLRWMGDVDLHAIDFVSEEIGKDIFVTPTPGGTGQLTVPMLLKNTIKAAKRQNMK